VQPCSVWTLLLFPVLCFKKKHILLGCINIFTIEINLIAIYLGPFKIMGSAIYMFGTDLALFGKGINYTN